MFVALDMQHAIRMGHIVICGVTLSAIFYHINKTGSTTLKEWTTPDSRITPSHTNPGEEGIADAPVNDGNTSMPEQVKGLNPWRKMTMMMISLRARFSKKKVAEY